MAIKNLGPGTKKDLLQENEIKPWEEFSKIHKILIRINWKFGSLWYKISYLNKKRILKKEKRKVLELINILTDSSLLNVFIEDILESIEFIVEDPAEERHYNLNIIEATSKVGNWVHKIREKQDFYKYLNKERIFHIVAQFFDWKIYKLRMDGIGEEYVGEEIRIFHYQSYDYTAWSVILEPHNYFFNFLKHLYKAHIEEYNQTLAMFNEKERGFTSLLIPKIYVKNRITDVLRSG